VNADGKLDIVWTHNDIEYGSCDDYQCYDPVTTRTARVLLGYGDGSFAAPAISGLGTVPVYGVLSSLALGDFDGDGFPDLAASESAFDYSYQGAVAVAPNDGIWALPPRASSFGVSAFPSPITVGTAGAFTVTARDALGGTLTNYSGKVHFTSSDPQAGLPADYTFTTADRGVHTFSATLKTAGPQSLTVTDLTTASATGSQAGITVNPAAASRFTVAGFPSPVTAGVAGSFTVTAWDAYGNRARGYTGTIRFTSSDAKAVLPGNYTFTAADAGMRTFSAVLKTAGTQSLTATDTVNASIAGIQYVTVNPAAASRLVLSAPASVKANAAFSLTVTVVDAYGNVATGYRNKIAFRSSDSTAKLPDNYTFTPADQGVHTFSGLVLKKKGKQTIAVTDTLNSSLTASVLIDVS
jgi:FG-GAP-like repeat